MTIETRSSALDPFLTMRSQSTLLMDPPSPQLLIDGDNLTVTNALDRTDDLAVLITGNNNVFVNQTGATLTGTGTNARLSDPEAAIEITGAGNSVENQAGATIAGTVGISSSAANTSIVNDGDILVADPGVQFFEDSIGVLLGTDSSVVNGGLVSASARGFASAVRAGDRTTVQNDGTLEVSGELAYAIIAGAGSTVVNNGVIDTTASLTGNGVSVTGPGSSVENFGVVRTESFISNAFGIGTEDTAVWNGGTVEAIASNRGNAQGVFMIGGSLDNQGTIDAVQTGGAGTAQAAFLSNASGSNAGSITALANNGLAIGVVSFGGNPFDNSGDIAATGSQAFGVVTVDFADLTNTGTVTANGSIDPPLETGRSAGFDLQNDVSVVNSGLVSASENFEVAGIFALDRANIQNAGSVEASGGLASAIGIGVGSDSEIVNSGTVLAQAEFGANGISAGDRATVQNDGAVDVSGLGLNGISVGSFSSIVNSGAVDVQAGPMGFAFALSAGERSSIHNDGIVEIASSEAFAVNAGSESMIENAGTVIVTTDSFGSGISAGPGSTIRNTGAVLVEGVGLGADANGVLGPDLGLVANTGTIQASAVSGSATGAFLGFGGSLLTNAGDITAIGLRAKGITAREDASVVNDGAISAQSVPAGEPSVGISFDSFGIAEKTVVNNGTITADIAISDNTASPTPEFDTLTVENTGLIAGALALGNGVDIVFNTGIIDGDVDLGSGNDVFDGRGGVVNGIVDGGEGDDIIYGGAGNEILIGGDGADIIFGSAGADAIDGGAGLDTLDYSASAAGVQVNLGDATLSSSAPVQAGAGTAFGGDAEGDTFQGIERVIGSAFDDFVYGGPEGSIVDLGDGNDVFDNRSADSGNDVVDLGAGNDVARAGAGDDLVQGGAGRDRLSGEDGNDTLLGQDGNDRLRGGLGDDRLDGGAGDDLLAGGAGNDLFTFGLDGGNDRIFDFDAGAGSDDVVDLTAFDTILSFDDVLGIASQIGGDDDDDDDGGVATVLTFDAETTLTFEGVRLAELNETDFIIA